MKVQYAGHTDVGLQRKHNEDSFSLMGEEQLFVVADGMGGHSAGEVASRIAVETLVDFYRDTAEDEDITWPFKMDKGLSYEENRMAAGVKLSNHRICDSARENPKQKGMGTTIVSTRFFRGSCVIGHVGDSRVYRVRDKTIARMTEDHSLLNDYIKMKDLTPEEIENFPHKNVVVRALGMKDTVQVEVIRMTPEVGDIYCLCSDGLCDMLTDSVIEGIINKSGADLDKCCQLLIDEANNAGGKDNITAVLVRVTEG